MAQTLPKMLSVLMTYEQYGRIEAGIYQLPAHVYVNDATHHADGTVTVTFIGDGLDSTWSSARARDAILNVGSSSSSDGSADVTFTSSGA
jgi:hypothetical protein